MGLKRNGKICLQVLAASIFFSPSSSNGNAFFQSISSRPSLIADALTHAKRKSERRLRYLPTSESTCPDSIKGYTALSALRHMVLAKFKWVLLIPPDCIKEDKDRY